MEKCQVYYCKKIATHTRLEKISNPDNLFEIETPLCSFHGHIVSNPDTEINWNNIVTNQNKQFFNNI